MDTVTFTSFSPLASPALQDLLQEVQCWQPDNSLEEIAARADAHLRQAQRNAVEAAVGQCPTRAFESAAAETL